MSNEKIIDLADLQAQTEELVTAIDAKDAATLGSAEDYADSCLLEAKDYADDQDASVLQDAKDYADSAASSAGSSAAAASIPLTQKGVPSGVAELDANGLVPSAQLPSFVDDVLEYQDIYAFPATGETGKIYVSLADNKTYRWSGSAYTEISASLALGTTDSTAGRGDWTYAGYQHALAKGSQFASNMYKITTNAEGHVVAATPVTKQDIVDLGIPGDVPEYSLPTMSPTTKGGAKLGDGLSIEDDTLNLGPLTKSDTGAEVTTDGSGIYGIQGEGFAHQDGTPTPSNPQPIMVARGRNLFKNTATTQTVNGITFTVNADKSVTCSGTATANADLIVDVSPSLTGTFTLSGCPQGGSLSTYYLNAQVNGSWAYEVGGDSGAGKTFTGTVTKIAISIKQLNTPINLTFYPQLERSTTPTPYVPYGYVGLEVRGGKNLLDEYTATRDVGVDSSGAIVSIPNYRLSDYIPVKENTTYYLTNVLGSNAANSAAIYDASKTFLRNTTVPGGSKVSGTINTGSNAAYMRVCYYYTADGTVQVEEGSAGTAYEPHRHITPVPLPSKGFLAALPDGTKDTLSIDSAGGVVVGNATNEAVFDGSSDEGWGLSSNNKRSYSNVLKPYARGVASISAVTPSLCTHFGAASPSALYGGTVGFGFDTDATFFITYTGEATTTAALLAFLSANPVTVLYPLATPTTESLGYIDLPSLPQSAKVSIPELEEIGVEWWVEGAGEVAKSVGNLKKKIGDRIDFIEDILDVSSIKYVPLTIVDVTLVAVGSTTKADVSFNASGVSALANWVARSYSSHGFKSPISIAGLIINGTMIDEGELTIDSSNHATWKYPKRFPNPTLEILALASDNIACLMSITSNSPFFSQATTIGNVVQVPVVVDSKRLAEAEQAIADLAAANEPDYDHTFLITSVLNGDTLATLPFYANDILKIEAAGVNGSGTFSPPYYTSSTDFLRVWVTRNNDLVASSGTSYPSVPFSLRVRIWTK